MTNETIFTYGAPPVKFGVGAVEEIGHDLGQLGIRRALLITDPGLVASGMPQGVADHIRAAGITAVVFGAMVCAWVLAADLLGVDYGLRLPGLTIKPACGAAHRLACLEALASC